MWRVAKGGQNLAEMLGLSGGAMAALGVGAAFVGLGVAANKLSEQWEKMAPQAMNLTALLGNLTGEYKSNSAAFLESFNRAANAANKFGYSAEEGMNLIASLAKAGTRAQNVYGAAEQVFAFEKGTGADRETLVQAEALAQRYRLGNNALAYTLGGAKAQGLEQAQYQEYLRATLRIFEEGLSRGVVKGFDEISRTQNFVALLGRGSPLWQGELGARRYEQMNQQFTQATLDSEYDVIRYQATRRVLERAAANNFQNNQTGNWAEYKKYGNVNDEGYLAVQRAREGGLTQEIFNETMNILKTQVAGGSVANLTEAVRMAFGVNYTAANDIVTAYSKGQFQTVKAVLENPKSTDSAEQRLQASLQQIRTEIANAGSAVLPAKEVVMNTLNGILGALVGDKATKRYQDQIGDTLKSIYTPKAGDTSKNAGAVGVAEGVLKTALTKDVFGGTDKGINGEGPNTINDNADAAMAIIDYFKTLPDADKLALRNSGILSSLFTGKTTVNDLPGIYRYLAQNEWKKTEGVKDVDAALKKWGNPFPSQIKGFFSDIPLKDWQKKYPGAETFASYAAMPGEYPETKSIFENLAVQAEVYKRGWDRAIENKKATPQDKDRAIQAFWEYALTQINNAMGVYLRDNTISPDEWKSFKDGLPKLLENAPGAPPAQAVKPISEIKPENTPEAVKAANMPQQEPTANAIMPKQPETPQPARAPEPTMNALPIKQAELPAQEPTANAIMPTPVEIHGVTLPAELLGPSNTAEKQKNGKTEEAMPIIWQEAAKTTIQQPMMFNDLMSAILLFAKAANEFSRGANSATTKLTEAANKLTEPTEIVLAESLQHALRTI
jgi:hypothetical protein